jgi:hypothetical protein
MSTIIKVGTRVKTDQGSGVVIATGIIGRHFGQPKSQHFGQRIATVSLSNGNILHDALMSGLVSLDTEAAQP